MKRTILFLVATIAMGMGAKAQQQTATLQRGNSTTYYYGKDAFKEAYNAANDGSIITLSSGYFNTMDTITKQITIRGNGYIGDKTVIGKGDSYFSLHFCADNIKIEGLYLEFGFRSAISKLKNLIIRNCYIPGFHIQNTRVTDAIIDNCKIGFSGHYFFENLCVKNSFVNLSHGPYGAGCSALFVNCVVGSFNKSSSYRNCLINVNGADSISFLDDREYLNNVFFSGVSSMSNSTVEVGHSAIATIDESTRYSTPTLPDIETSNIKGNSVALFDDIFNYTNEENPLYAPIITTITGDDGKVVGPYGGTGFSETLSFPRITESKIDTYTDGEGKLNVKVKVEVGQ